MNERFIEGENPEYSLNPPTVLYFSSATHVQGGAVQSMFKMARWLKREGGRPIVVLPRQGGILNWYREENVPVFVLPFVEMHRDRSLVYLARYALSTLVTVWQLAKLIKQQNIDIVHVNEIIYWPGLVAGKIAGVPTICHVRVILERPEWVRRGLTWLARHFADQVLCVSRAVQQKMFPPQAHNVRVLYNPGPDLDRFDPRLVAGRAPVRQQLGIESDALVVGLVSKFVPSKGHLALIEAARWIEERGNQDSLTYVLVGGQVPGHEEYWAEVQQRLEEYDLHNRFILTGARTDVPELIAACDVMVHLPLHEDPLPNVVFEALAMEKPFVGFASGGVPEQFENGKSGILLEKGDVQSLAETLITLEKDRDLGLKIGQKGRRFLTSHFSFQRFFSELKAIYTEVL